MRETFSHSNATGLSDGQVEVRVRGRANVVKSTAEEGLLLEDGSLLVLAKSGATVLIREPDGKTTSRYKFRAGAGWTLTRSRRVEKWSWVPVHPDAHGVADINGAKALKNGTFVVGHYTLPAGKRTNIRDGFGNHFFSNPEIDHHLYWRTPAGSVIVVTYLYVAAWMRVFFWAQWVLEVTEEVVHDDEKKTGRIGLIMSMAILLASFILFILWPLATWASQATNEGFPGKVGETLASVSTLAVLGVICWVVKKALWAASATPMPDPKIPPWDEL